MNKRDKYLIALTILASRLTFIFMESAISSKSILLKPNQHHNSAAIQQMKPVEKTKKTKKEKAISPVNINKITKNTQNINDIIILERLYKKQQDIKILNSLIEKLTQNYQFDKALKYIEDSKVAIDPDLHIYILLNSGELSVTKPSSMEKIKKLIDQYRNQGQITSHDYLFYQGLAKIWYNDFQGADMLLRQIESPRYIGITSQIINTFEQLKKQKDIPDYYQESLIALTLMKSGYFNIAKKIALQAAIKDDSYILPNQILAYAHFLTNNWEQASEYLLDLAEIDKANQEKYKFMAGVCFYRMKDYETSVLYLSQIKNLGELQIDVYRYLILNYIKGGDYSNQTKIWQKVLGQNNLDKSDFHLFFKESIYRPFSNGWGYEINKTNPQLINMFVNKCLETLSDDNLNICTYGKIGPEIIKGNLKNIKDTLLYLSQNNGESYLNHVLGNYYIDKGERELAKNYYVKALTKSVDDDEKTILNRKLKSFSDIK